MGSKIRTILQTALQAGKAARDPNKVPEIKTLQAYNSGEGGRYSKPDAPTELVQIAAKVNNNFLFNNGLYLIFYLVNNKNELDFFCVAKAAVDLAIEPAIQKCMLNIQAMDSAEAISTLRKSAKDIISESFESRGREIQGYQKIYDEKVKRVNQILHEPTMKLRQGKAIDKESILQQITNELEIKN